MANKKSNIVTLIKKLVQEEVRKAIRPAINEVLAEHFLNTLSTSKGTIAPSLVEVAAPKEAPYPKRAPLSVNTDSYKRQIMENFGQNAHLFEDVDPSDMPSSSTPTAPLPAGVYEDDDSEGVDISSFLKRN